MGDERPFFERAQLVDMRLSAIDSELFALGYRKPLNLETDTVKIEYSIIQDQLVIFTIKYRLAATDSARSTPWKMTCEFLQCYRYEGPSPDEAEIDDMALRVRRFADNHLRELAHSITLLHGMTPPLVIDITAAPQAA